MTDTDPDAADVDDGDEAVDSPNAEETSDAEGAGASADITNVAETAGAAEGTDATEVANAADVADVADAADAPDVADASDAEDSGDETEDGTVEPVELLVQLADDGEIDPWSIDVVAVTDEFLARLDESDLRTGGRALFYASVLLRMKSDALLQDGDSDEPDGQGEAGWDEGAWEGLPPDGPPGDGRDGPISAGDPFEELEREMDRRLQRKRARGMPRTLDELVRELRERERESYMKRGREYDTSDSPHGFSRGTQTLDYHVGDDRRMDDEPTEAAVTGTAHDERIEEIISEVYLALREHFDAGRDEVLYAEISGAGGSRVETFLGLLFLSNRGQIVLQQDDLFGDLWVQDPAAVTEPEEAIAD